ncbi:MAG: hypothetical protein QOE08_2494 [Thermoleophilaceae bacterium]|nr:hypothetical protein [Thermoleophilaceae bacterium]
MTGGPRGLALAALLTAATAAPASAAATSPGVPELQPVAAVAAPTHPWTRRVRSAAAFARGRAGRVSFAVIDERRHMHGVGMDSGYRSASVVKAMLMVAYLRRREVRHRRLGAFSHGLLGPMITHSDNIAASRVRNIVGNPGLAALARRAGMRHFATAHSWGDSWIDAADQVRFFIQIDKLVPPRHRTYAMKLLASVVAWHRWGIPHARPHGWEVYFKGGWRRLAGRKLVNQVALLTNGDRRIAVAILTDGNRTYHYGMETVRGVATRLLSGLEDSEPPRPRFRPLRSLG